METNTTYQIPAKDKANEPLPPTPCSAWRKDHHGMRVCIEGLMDTLTGKRGEITKGDLWLAEQFTKHLKELGRRFYQGDLTVVDEFLQLYDLDQLRSKVSQNVKRSRPHQRGRPSRRV